MTIEELEERCKQAEEFGARFQSEPAFQVALSRKAEPAGQRVQVLPGVTGEFLCSQQRKDGKPGCEIVVAVKAADVRRFIARHRAEGISASPP